jgi:ketosteroid isomerase-like protein
MKVIRIIAIILVSVGMAFILACGEQKTASLEGNEDIAAVIQRLPECYENSKTVMEIYSEDAVFERQDPTTGNWNAFKGLKEIEDYKKERSNAMRNLTLSISSIKKEADKAHVEYLYIRKGVEGKSMDWEQSSSAELVKKGQTWKIQMEKVGAY